MIEAFDDIKSESCFSCEYLKGEFCSIFTSFINGGVDFENIPFLCPLPDFEFDGEVLKWI